MDRSATKAGSPLRVLALGLLVVATGGRATLAGSLSSPGCLDGGAPAVVTGLESGLDLRLADGRLVRLAGIDPERNADSPGRDSLLRWLQSRAVKVAPLRSETDRWGRTPALVFAPAGPDAGAPAVSVGEALLEAGFARARPDETLAACWATYLGLEEDARKARRGIWADPAAAVLGAADTTALRAHLGEFVVVEGTVASVFEGRLRTYLRFGDARPGMFAASLDRQALLRVRRSGSGPASWLHRSIRLRGLLDDRWGLQIEIAEPQQIELITP